MTTDTRKSFFAVLFKREFFTPVRSGSFYISAAVFALIAGTIFSLSVLNGMSVITVELLFLQMSLLIFVPILSMRAFAMDRETGSDRLLMSAPVPVLPLVAAKFTAIFLQLFLISLIVVPHAIMTLIMGGRVDRITLVTYFVFLLTALPFIAISIYVSLRASGVAAAALLSFLLLCALQYMDVIADLIGRFAARILEGLDIFGWGSAHTYYGSGQVLRRILSQLNPASHLESVGRGVLSLNDLIYPLSLAVFFLLLTWLRLKHGGYERRVKMSLRSWIAISVAALILVGINIPFAAHGPLSHSWDLSSSSLRRIGSVSRQMLGSLKHDMQFIVLDEADDFALRTQFLPELLEDYVRASEGRMSLKYVPASEQESLLKKIDPESLRPASRGQLLLYRPDNGRLYNFRTSDLLRSTADEQGDILPATDAEAEISGAILRFNREKLPVVYRFVSQGDGDMDAAYTRFYKLIRDNGFDLRSFTAQNGEAVPADASFVLLNDPGRDLLEPELAVLRNYVQDGGRLLIAPALKVQQYSNLSELISEFGLDFSGGMIMEGDPAAMYGGDPHMLIARLAPQQGQALAAQAVLLKDAGEIRVAEGMASQNVQPLIQGSSRAYLASPNISEKDEAMSQTNQQSVPNPLLAVLARNPSYVNPSNGEAAQIILLSTPTVFSDRILNLAGDSAFNLRFAYSCLNYLGEDDPDGKLLIQRKAIPSYGLNLRSAGPAYLAACVAILLIPSMLLAAAMIQRRKRNRV